jgi:Zn finger protein HypA/HybF involved in hydrogenase expression
VLRCRACGGAADVVAGEELEIESIDVVDEVVDACTG